MAQQTTAKQIADGVAFTPQKFYVRKEAIAAMLLAIRGERPGPMNPQGRKGLADRTDISGKFARRIGQNRRALERANEQITEERLELVKQHAKRYPELTTDGEPHPNAGEIMPVYATDAAGAPIFKKDKAGNDTEERVIAPDSYDIADQKLFQKEFRELLREFIVVECPGFTEDDWNSFKANPNQDSPIGQIIDPLIDLERDGPTTHPPAGVTVENEPDRRTLALTRDEPEPEPTAP